jgi:hypothetical protein
MWHVVWSMGEQQGGYAQADGYETRMNLIA